MGLDGYWAAVESQAKRLCTARTVEQVIDICPGHSAGDGFWGGDGDSLLDILFEGGWRSVDVRAAYYWALKEPEGDGVLSYVEGDLYKGNNLVPA